MTKEEILAVLQKAGKVDLSIPESKKQEILNNPSLKGYLADIEEIAEKYGLKFQKGCSDLVKVVAKDFISKYGKENLKEVCKTHFKTYNEV